MGDRSVTGQFVGTVGVFSLLGPLVGTGVAWIGLAWVLVTASSNVGASFAEYVPDLPFAMLLSVVIGYVVGVVPAAVTGVVCHLFARSIQPTWLWVCACTLIGALCGGMAPLVLGLVDLWTSLTFGVCGAAGGAACAWKLRHDRWPAHAWKP